MTTIEIIAVAALVLLFTGLAYLAAWRRSRREAPRRLACLEAFRQWGAARRLELDPENLELIGTAHGVRVILRARFDDEDSGMPYEITMAAVADHVTPAVLQIAHVGWSRSERLARQPLVSGDPAFDERFRVWCDPQGLLFAVLTPELRAAMMTLAPTEFFYDRGVIEVCWNELFDQVETPLHDLDAAFSVIRAAAGIGS